MVRRFRNLPPRSQDAILALIAFVDVVAEIAAQAPEKLWQGAVLMTALPAALMIRRRRPLGALVLCICAFMSTNFADRDVAEGLFAPFVVVLGCVFSMAYYTEGRRRWIGAGLWWLAASIGTLTDQYESSVGDLVFVTLLMTAFPVVGGTVLRNRTDLARSLREKAERLEAERERSAQQAALEERERIASELHDVVAHALGAMTVQAAAARRLVAKDPPRAAEAFRVVEDQGRAALSELRRVLGVLRREDEELALAPQPSLAHLSTLAQRARAAGLPVELDVGEAPESVPAGVDLTAYRLVQEALNEALSNGHAGRARVAVRYEPGAVNVEVADDGAGERRLVGIRERVHLVGGSLEVEPGAAGHRVRARLPLEVPG